MRQVMVALSSQDPFRATEVLADLRNVAETLYHPMRMVGFWDGPSGQHLCPQQRGGRCPHQGQPADKALEAYRQLADERLGAILEVQFPHADVRIFLA